MTFHTEILNFLNILGAEIGEKTENETIEALKAKSMEFADNLSEDLTEQLTSPTKKFSDLILFLLKDVDTKVKFVRTKRSGKIL